jgi:hypothetical protein
MLASSDYDAHFAATKDDTPRIWRDIVQAPANGNLSRGAKAATALTAEESPAQRWSQAGEHCAHQRRVLLLHSLLRQAIPKA